MLAQITFIANGNVAKVPSETKEGLVYLVDLKHGVCNCADARFRGRFCKHLKAAEATKQEEERKLREFFAASRDESPSSEWDEDPFAEVTEKPGEPTEQDKGASLLNECKALSEAELTILIGNLIDLADDRKMRAAALSARDEWEALERMLDDCAVIDDSSTFAEQDERLAALIG